MAEVEAERVELNAAQAEAVAIKDGPVLVVAGAGTGKTRVTTERILRLIEQGVPPSQIVALTFTEKAAGEMLDRVGNASLGAALDTTIATFNGFGNDLLQAYGPEYGLGNLRLLGDTGQLVFLRSHLDDFELDYFAPISRPDGQLAMLADYVSRLKQQLVKPADYLAYAEKLPRSTAAEQLERQKHQELARFYETYLKLCRENQVIDYDDQLYLTLELLQARPNVLADLQARYRFLLVDEFQDTNPMQAALVDLLAGKSQNVMVVGDDDQSIYGWRGATLANILDFKTRYPAAREITLTENYRSTQQILDSAYRLIQHNNPNRLEVINQLDKRLHAQTGPGMAPQTRRFLSFEAELNWLAEDIMRRIAAGQDPAGIAVLTRRNQGVQKVHEVLELHDVAHAVAGLSNDIYDQPAVRQLVEALKCVADPLDDLALFHTLSGPLFSLDVHLLANLSGAARREHLPLLDHLRVSEEESITIALITIDDWRARSSQQSVGSLAYDIITESGWKDALYHQAQTDINMEREVQAISKFFTTLKEFERIAAVASAQAYIVNLPTLQAAGSGFEDASLDISDSMVNVLSVHRAKGLEWDTVYIADCTEGSFPLRNFGSGLTVPPELQANPTAADEHMAEERRLMYVAATRARRELILSCADRHGSGAPRKPSRFLTELLGAEPAGQAQVEADQTSLELFAPRLSTTAIELPGSMQQNDRLVLSVSQIDCWLRCPQEFYYQHVLAMPQPPAPHLTYGTLVHGIIERLHRARAENRALPTLEEIEAETLAKLPSSGYASARSRERAHAQARQTIHKVYERFISDPLPLETEQPFAAALRDVPLIIKGRIDAVYPLGQGIEIRDFKTGTAVSTPEKAKQRATGSNQLTLYALAWRQLRGDMPALLTLDFVETGQLGSVKKQAKSLDTLEHKLEDMVTNLRAGRFAPGSDHTHCHHPLNI